jgi:hypothetical protein
MQFINSEYCFFFFLLFIHCEAEYEHFTDNTLNEKSVLTVFFSNKFVFKSKNKPNLI